MLKSSIFLLVTGLRYQYHSIWIYNRVLRTECCRLVFLGQKLSKRDTKTQTKARLNKPSLSYSAALNLTKMSKYTELREPHTRQMDLRKCPVSTNHHVKAKNCPFIMHKWPTSKQSRKCKDFSLPESLS